MSQSSRFDYKGIASLFKSGEERKGLVHMARTSEMAERYDDMCVFMKELVNLSDKDKKDLSVDERNLLSVSYKNVIGARRASWRTLNACGDEEESKSHPGIIDVYKQQVATELHFICKEVLDLLRNILIKNLPEDQALSMTPDQLESKVFYLKMTGDYFRYMAEFVGDADTDVKNNARTFYEKAMTLATSHFEPTHPIRLGLALNYSVCLYEISKEKSKACEVARAAFDEAISKLDKLNEASYKDSTLIMQLLRDNLALWTSDIAAHEDGGAEADNQ